MYQVRIRYVDCFRSVSEQHYEDARGYQVASAVGSQRNTPTQGTRGRGCGNVVRSRRVYYTTSDGYRTAIRFDVIPITEKTGGCDVDNS